MIRVKLPDGSQKEFANSVTVLQVAESIGAGLAKAALGAKVNQKLVDLSYLIEQDVELVLITSRDELGLELIRHSTAHLLAHAVKSLYPDVQVTIGPVIENGFYYDFATNLSFNEEDLIHIEKKMHELAGQAIPVHRKEMSRDEAIRFFEQQGEHYKVEIIRDISEGETLSFYQQGDFIDLCRGPHVPNTSCLKAFKLTKVAGAYWRGNSNNAMLQRIYGTAWADQKSLDQYLHQLEEAEKRDHRKIGKHLDLFHLQEEAPGMVFWHPKGWTIYSVVMDYIRARLNQAGYQEIRTPLVLDRSLWERSGHWDKFAENMFTLTAHDRDFAIKPMNCPCHIQVFNQGLKSYRDLPLRFAEFGMCHRNEASGALHGIMRVINMTQDDGHIFCTEDQIQDEVIHFIDLLFAAYRDFGFSDIEVRLATRPEQRVGSDEIWDKAEQALHDALNHKNISFTIHPGEGAFYGPKIEFHLRDCINRVWQCGTMQLDFSMPDRLGATYIAESGEKKVPVMLHRAICGSLERFIGILIEHYAGAFPTWLAPVQVMVCNITERQSDYVQKVTDVLVSHGIRAQCDLRNEKIGFKIREHTIQKIPYLLVVGDREVETETVAIRTRSGEDLGTVSVKQLIEQLQKEISLLANKNIA